MTYQIEKGIPMPENRSGRRSDEGKYPFKNLDVGDSFFVPCVSDAECVAIRVAANYWRKRLPDRQFSTSHTDGGVRVWRTA